ncbi:unnamed protein product, partial [Prunus brigantina]
IFGLILRYKRLDWSLVRSVIFDFEIWMIREWQSAPMDELIHIAVRGKAVVNHVQTVNTNIIASPFLLEAVPNNDSFAQDEDTCKYSSQTGSIVDSSAASSSCLSTDFDGISSEYGNKYLGKYGSCGGRKYLSTNWEGYITHEGQKFEGGVCEFRDKLAKYSIENGFKMMENETRRVTAVCAKKESNGCEWHVHAVKSNVNGFFYIKNLNNIHSCSGLIREKRNKAMGSRLVSSIVKDKVRSNPLVRPIELIIDLNENYGLDIPYRVAWYGKESATKDLHGDEELSYAHLPWYVDVLKASNVGSQCVLDCGEDGSRFQRIFICFKASIDGFRWCRPMVFIDGTFVTNKYKGTLLGATTKNGNKGIMSFKLSNISGLCLYNFVDEYYKADFYRATYATPIFPIPNIEKPPPGDVFLLPPHTRKPPGRPPTKRFKSSNETKRQVKCKRCGSYDRHNRRTCKVHI